MVEIFCATDASFSTTCSPASDRGILSPHYVVSDTTREINLAIWHRPYDIGELNEHLDDGLVGHLGIRYTAVGDDYLEGELPVDERTLQPAGILHGGATAALAETLGSTAANMCVDRERFLCVGLELNINHLRAKRNGHVIGRATPVHVGSSTQVWEIRIRDSQGKAVSISRLTMSVLERKRIKGDA
jgi:1,4-dihydroxy-2-naphthoyl-CoA hydrolase